MRRIVIWFASTVTVVVLLLGYHTSTSPASAAGSSASAPVTPSGTSSASGPPSTSSGSGSKTGTKTGTTAGTKTFTGDVAQTRWGPVEVEITVADGRVTAVDVLQSPSGNHHDVEINDRALPVLVQETLDAQSAKIDMVSGATVTSDGYVSSLQSALDKAGI